MNNPVPSRILHYEIIEKLGQGKNGEVFKAYDTGPQRVVALKLLWESAESQLNLKWRETLEVLSKVHHANVAERYAVDEFEGRGLIISEYVDGRTLQEIIGKVPFSDKRLLGLATQSAQGLKALHDRGIAHGNITATNLMLGNNNIVKLLDSGMYHPEGRPTEDRAADDGRFPNAEQITEVAPAEETDLYRLGLLLYSLAVGRVLDGNEAISASDGTDVARTLDLKLLCVTELERDSCLMISQLLAEDRADRLSGIDALLTTLHGIAEFKRGLPAIDEEQPRPIPRNIYLMTALLAVLLIVFWFMIFTFNR